MSNQSLNNEFNSFSSMPRLIRRTKSLSPFSYGEVEAQIVQEDGAVYMTKQDEQGKEYKFLIEKDNNLYELLTKENVPVQVFATQIVISVTSACNLNCLVCYDVKDIKNELLTEDIKVILKQHRNRIVLFTGKEPTCRENLIELIRLANKLGHIVAILTNGIKLADYEYVLKLKKNGLRVVVFSFNGFKDDIYQRINGQPLLELKLKALENIRRTGLKTILSATIVRGVNDDQLKPLCLFALNNRTYIYELRIRAMVYMGRYTEQSPYCMSELIGLMSTALMISKEDVYKEHVFWTEFFQIFKRVIPTRSQDYFKSRRCTFFLHIIRRNKIVCSPGSMIDPKRVRDSKFKIFFLIYYLFKIYGVLFIIERICAVFGVSVTLNKNILTVALKCWSNIYNIDLEENKKCTSLYYKSGKAYPFCYYNILESENCIEKVINDCS